MLRKLTIIGFVVLLSACASVGKEFSSSDIASIEKGKTPESEVLRLFGTPYSQVVDGDGNKIYIWTYAHAVAFGPVEVKSLAVKFNKNGVVNTFRLAETN